MSFIDDSIKNVKLQLMKEVSGGGIAGFTGRAGRDIDALFAGPFHPDSGHGSENKQLLTKQLKDRREKRKDLRNCVESFEKMEDSVEDIISWKDNVSKALWILFTAVVGLLVHMVMGN